MSTGTDNSPNGLYTGSQTTLIGAVYVGAAIVWIGLVHKFKLIKQSKNFMGLILLLIPLLMFTLAIVIRKKITEKVEDFMSRANMLTLGLLIALPLFNWVKGTNKSLEGSYTQLVATGVIASMLSIMDVWVSEEHLPVVKHIKSALETISIGVLMFAMFMFYLDSSSSKSLHKNNH
jgi:hypothetical protein